MSRAIPHTRRYSTDRTGRKVVDAGSFTRKPPLVMGILNVTPDSFSDGGDFQKPEAALNQALAMVEAGADIIDVGGESTRPGAVAVSVKEELSRTIPVIQQLARRVRAPISIDTAKAEVAEAALKAGASIVNDVTALRGDAPMAEVIAKRGASVILMHMAGNPRTMQRRPRYRNVLQDVAVFLSKAAQRAIAAGIEPRRIWIDPGLGFGKTVEHNRVLMAGIPNLSALGYPVVIGASRKSFIGKILGDVPVGERLVGSLACVGWALRQGAAMVRVHDVRETVDWIRMIQALQKGKNAIRR